ncbi:hypothetical protein BBP40_006183 [Aspergillus hancockii]|nr:hypothetical protein BBP40_006183 [Aspergillus hancockii]
MANTTPDIPPPGAKRKRVGVACNTCRAQKIRCDGIRPYYGTCQRRRDRCIFDPDDSVRKSKSLRAREQAPMASRSQGGSLLLTPAPVSSAGPIPITAKEIAHEGNDTGVTAMGLAVGPLDRNQSSPREFFGGSSTVAFIQQLQHSLRPDLLVPGSDGELPYHTTDEGDQNRYPKPSTTPSPPVQLLPPRPLADHLVDCYFSKIHTLYPFVHKHAFLGTYRSLWTTSGSRPSIAAAHGLGIGDVTVNHTTFYCALNAIFALGCQFSDVVQVQRETISEAFFRRCKPVLDVEYLEGGSLAECQTLLLITHYLQCSRTPNRCWHVIGIACRLAQALGLHSDIDNEGRSFAEIQLRRRIWHGCVMLDLCDVLSLLLLGHRINLDRAVSTILGRPAMIAQGPVAPFPAAIDDCYLSADTRICEQPPHVLSRVAWFIETLKLYDTLRKILRALYDNTGSMESRAPGNHLQTGNARQIQSIIEIDADLEDFKAKLPEALKWDHEVLRDQPDNFEREKCLLRAR